MAKQKNTNIQACRPIWAILITAGAVVAVAAKLAGESRPMQVAPSVELPRYMGKWYEVARLPNRFQKQCASNTTATYTLRPDGKIAVINECRKANGQVTSAKGAARPADPKGPNSKLKVTFFWPFSGDYWILDLDPDYRWALIGEPGRKYLWVLSRTPRLDDAVLQRILDRARREGYDLDGLIKTPQT